MKRIAALLITCNSLLFCGGNPKRRERRRKEREAVIQQQAFSASMEVAQSLPPKKLEDELVVSVKEKTIAQKEAERALETILHNAFEGRLHHQTTTIPTTSRYYKAMFTSFDSYGKDIVRCCGYEMLSRHFTCDERLIIQKFVELYPGALRDIAVNVKPVPHPLSRDERAVRVTFTDQLRYGFRRPDPEWEAYLSKALE